MADCKCQGFYQPLDCPVHGRARHDQPVSQTVGRITVTETHPVPLEEVSIEVVVGAGPSRSSIEAPPPLNAEESANFMRILERQPNAPALLVDALRRSVGGDGVVVPSHVILGIPEAQIPCRPAPLPYPPRDIDVDAWETLNRHSWWTVLTVAQQAELWNEALPRLIARIRELEGAYDDDLQEAERRADKAEEELGEAESNLKEAKDDLKAKEEEVKKLAAKLERVKEDRDEHYKDLHEAKLENGTLEAANEDLSKKNIELEAEVTRLRAQLEAAGAPPTS